MNNDTFLVHLAQEGNPVAFRELWDHYGDIALNAAVQQSYKVNSDFSLYGSTAKERARALMGECYLRFHKDILHYDAACNVPLDKYIAQRIGYMVLDHKRNNSKLSFHESRNGSLHFEEFESPAYGEPSMAEIADDAEKLLKADSKAYGYYTTARRTYGTFGHGAENEIARQLGCSRTTVCNLREKTRSLLEGKGMQTDFYDILSDRREYAVKKCA